MLQETTNAAVSNAAGLSQMGFADMIEHMDAVNWTVLIVLIIMSARRSRMAAVLRWFLAAVRPRSRADRDTEARISISKAEGPICMMVKSCW